MSAAPDTETFRLVLEVITTAVICLVSYITLAIKTSVSNIKIEAAENNAKVVKAALETKAELVAYNAALRTEVAVQTAITDQRFSDLKSDLQRLEKKSDRNYNAMNNNGSH